MNNKKGEKRSKRVLAEGEPLGETLTNNTFRGNFPYNRNGLWVSGVGPRPLGLSVKDPWVFALAHRGPSTGWQSERWEKRPATPFPYLFFFAGCLLYVCVSVMFAFTWVYLLRWQHLAWWVHLMVGRGKQGVLVPAYLSTRHPMPIPIYGLILFLTLKGKCSWRYWSSFWD